MRAVHPEIPTAGQKPVWSSTEEINGEKSGEENQGRPDVLQRGTPERSREKEEEKNCGMKEYKSVPLERINTYFQCLKCGHICTITINRTSRFSFLGGYCKKCDNHTCYENVNKLRENKDYLKIYKVRKKLLRK